MVSGVNYKLVALRLMDIKSRCCDQLKVKGLDRLFNTGKYFQFFQTRSLNHIMLNDTEIKFSLAIDARLIMKRPNNFPL